jgi:hypothetical protein
MSRENDIMSAIMGCYMRLSPENLWQDGEASPAEVAVLSRKYQGKLQELFTELGREVSEDEVYKYFKRNFRG